MYADISREVIGAAFEIHSTLGPHLLESVYRRALTHELEIRGIRFETEVPIEIDYKGIRVGDYRAYLIVEDRIMVELKAVQGLVQGHCAQLKHYLVARNLRLGLLLNFGTPSLQVKRFILGSSP